MFVRKHEQTVKLDGNALQVSDPASRLRVPVRQQMKPGYARQPTFGFSFVFLRYRLPAPEVGFIQRTNWQGVAIIGQAAEKDGAPYVP